MQPGFPLLGRRRCDCGECTPWNIMPQLEAIYSNVDGSSKYSASVRTVIKKLETEWNIT